MFFVFPSVIDLLNFKFSGIARTSLQSCLLHLCYAEIRREEGEKKEREEERKGKKKSDYLNAAPLAYP